MIQEQKEIVKLVEEGYTIVLLGTPKHPEVVGLLGFAPNAIVVDEEEDWDQIPRKKKMALISQSTQPPWKFEKLAAFMVSRSHELKIVNTVCPVTIRRQEDTLETAREVDLMVVVGGRSSANTKELTRLCGIVGTQAIQIESVRDLADAAPFEGAKVVGVTGGTSTPIEDLHAVAQRILEMAGTPEARSERGGPRRRGLRPRRDARRPHHLAADARFAGRRASRRGPMAADTGLPIVAIVGRPNVGKSTLFNRIVGERAAIVEDRARTTRDRLYGVAEWNGRRFMIVDTGGLEVDPRDPIEARVQDQARIAIAEADVIVFVVEAITGLTPADEEAAALLRRAKAPVLVAVNKSDNPKRELEAAEFYALGWEQTYPIAAVHGRGVADLLDEVVMALPPESDAELARKRREAEADAVLPRRRVRPARADRRRRVRTADEGEDDPDDADGRRSTTSPRAAGTR